MKQFKIFINETMEDERALVEVSDNNKLLLKGDYYHDKIREQIQGFLKGVSYCDVPYTLDNEYIKPNHELFYELDFYNDSDEIEED